MADPNSIIPAGSAIPVTAQRLQQQPQPMQPQQILPQQPSAPMPHIIYINSAAPPVVAQPQQPAPPPQVTNHYTTHNHHAYRGPRVVAGHSALGMASLALGILTCVICWVPVLGLIAVPVGAIGTVLGILGAVVSILFRRSSASLPIAGVFVCCLAAGISIGSTKSLPYWRQQLGKYVPAVAPMPGSGPVIAPPAVPQLPLSQLPRSIQNPLEPAPVVVPSPAAVPAKSTPPVKSPPAPPVVDPAVTAAMARLTQAQQACEARVRQSPEYADAIQAVASAKAKADVLRQTAPHTFELQDAGRAVIDADNAVSNLLNRAVASDPEVMLARNALAAAKAGSR